MKSKGKLTATIDAPKELLAQLAIMSLSDNGYPAGLHNLLDEITASKRKSQRAGGIGYDLEFSVKLSWQAIVEAHGDAGGKTVGDGVRVGDRVGVGDGVRFGNGVGVGDGVGKTAREGGGKKRTKLTVTVTEKEGHVSESECKKECFNLIKGINDRAADFVSEMSRSKARTTYGNARWATAEDLAAANFSVATIDSSQLLLGPGQSCDDKFLALPAEETERHALVCGPTGCGKTSTLFVPNLLERTNWSAIVSEATTGKMELAKDSEELPSGGPDLFRKTAGYRASKGHKIYYFNPDDLSSHRINPIEGITTTKESSRLATLLIKNTSVRVDTTADPFWETAETALLTSLIMDVAGSRGHMGDVRNLLREGPKELAKKLQNSVVAEARARYEEFVLWTTENTRNSIVIGLMQRLELWTQPSIVALTEKNDMNFEELKNELFTFYLAVPADKPELKPCAAVIFTYLLDFVAYNDLKHRLSLYLDEFTNFGSIAEFPNKLSIIRHRHIPAMLGLQDYNQAEEIYKTTATTLFSQPATRIFFKPQTLAQAKIISESLGVQNVYERSVSSNCQISEKEFGRELMTPGEVLMLPKGRAIVFTPDTNPVNLERFEPNIYDERSSISPPTRRVLQVDDSLIRSCDVARDEQRQAEIAYMRTEQAKLNAERERESRVSEGSSEDRDSSKQTDASVPPRDQLYNEYGDRIPRL